MVSGREMYSKRQKILFCLLSGTFYIQNEWTCLWANKFRLDFQISNTHTRLAFLFNSKFRCWVSSQSIMDKKRCLWNKFGLVLLVSMFPHLAFLLLNSILSTKQLHRKKHKFSCFFSRPLRSRLTKKSIGERKIAVLGSWGVCQRQTFPPYKNNT